MPARREGDRGCGPAGGRPGVRLGAGLSEGAQRGAERVGGGFTWGRRPRTSPRAPRKELPSQEPVPIEPVLVIDVQTLPKEPGDLRGDMVEFPRVLQLHPGYDDRRVTEVREHVPALGILSDTVAAGVL